jgi:hypothetical protein
MLAVPFPVKPWRICIGSTDSMIHQKRQCWQYCSRSSHGEYVSRRPIPIWVTGWSEISCGMAAGWKSRLVRVCENRCSRRRRVDRRCTIPARMRCVRHCLSAASVFGRKIVGTLR